jgi:hypothetical protein
MEKELLMKRIIAAFALFALTTPALVTHASAQDQPFKADVPFAFTVGNRELPVGSYRIQPFGPTQVRIENAEHEVFASAFGIVSSKSWDENKKLVFDKVGEQYFLRGIVSTSTMLELPKSNSEKKAQMLMKQSISSYTNTPAQR